MVRMARPDRKKMLMLILGGLLAQYFSQEEWSIRVLPDRPAQGQIVVVNVEGVDSGVSLEGTFGSKALRFFPVGDGRLRALSAVPLGQEPGPMVATVLQHDGDRSPSLRSTAVWIRAGVFPEEILKVDNSFVVPPKELRGRIKSEDRTFDDLWKAKPAERLWRGSFDWPGNRVISSHFGTRRIFNHRQLSQHRGLDIDGQIGDPVRAIGAGQVLLSTDRYYSGHTIVIDHGLRLYSYYFHMSERFVEQGQTVIQGQVIGKIGTTGRSTGPHLHLGTAIENLSFDPISLLDLDLDE